MRKNFVPKYRYYTNGKDIVVAVSSYAGRTIRGVAKCSEQDEFDLETGKKLAAARCAMKIARERVEDTKYDYEVWQRIVKECITRLEKATDKYTDATEILKQAKAEYNILIEKL